MEGYEFGEGRGLRALSLRKMASEQFSSPVPLSRDGRDIVNPRQSGRRVLGDKAAVLGLKGSVGL